MHLNARQYLLVCLIEECAEVAQRATKALRFGAEEIQPGQELNNMERLSGELNDLLGTLNLLLTLEGTTDISISDDLIAAKRRKLLKFAAYSSECGILDSDGLELLRELETA